MLEPYDQILARARCNSNQPSKRFDSEYMPDFEKTLRCIGRALSSSRTGIGTAAQLPICESHESVAMLVAGDAMKQLDESRYRAWSDGETGLSLMLVWERVIFRYCLVYSIGFIVSQTSVKKTASSPSWSPAFQDLNQYAPNDSYSLDFSNRHLQGAPISLATHMRLFPEDFHSTSPMVSLALSDAYSHKPDSDNPVSTSFQRALRKYFKDNLTIALPFWWAFAINHSLAYQEITPLPTHFVADASSPKELTIAHEIKKTPIRQVRSTRSRQAPQKDSVDTVSGSGLVPSVTQRLYKSGAMKVNGPGASFHVYKGNLYGVYPSVIDRIVSELDKPGFSAEQVIGELSLLGLLDCDSGSPESTKFEIVPTSGPNKGRPVGRTHLIQLAEGAHKVLLDPSLDLIDNPDIRPGSPGRPPLVTKRSTG